MLFLHYFLRTGEIVKMKSGVYGIVEKNHKNGLISLNIEGDVIVVDGKNVTEIFVDFHASNSNINVSLYMAHVLNTTLR